MGVAFFSHADSIDYKKIGGLESLFRRVSDDLIRDGNKVEFVLYGAPNESVLTTETGVTIRYFKSYASAATHLLSARYSIVSNYIKKRHRIQFFAFRARNRRRMSFFRIASGIDEDWKKRLVLGLPWVRRSLQAFETQITLSKSVERFFARQGVKTVLCSPPVPKAFFKSEEVSTRVADLEITFVGRFDENKGIPRVLEIFRQLAPEPGFKLNMSGYFGHGLSARTAVKQFMSQHEAVAFSELSWEGWSREVDLELTRLLGKTDILVLPYQNLQGTMDPPYLVLEGMASRCVILTTNVGSIHDYLPDDRQILPESEFAQTAIKIIKDLRDKKNLLQDIQNQNRRMMEKRQYSAGSPATSDWSKVLCERET